MSETILCIVLIGMVVFTVALHLIERARDKRILNEYYERKRKERE